MGYDDSFPILFNTVSLFMNNFHLFSGTSLLSYYYFFEQIPKFSDINFNSINDSNTPLILFFGANIAKIFLWDFSYIYACNNFNAHTFFLDIIPSFNRLSTWKWYHTNKLMYHTDCYWDTKTRKWVFVKHTLTFFQQHEFFDVYCRAYDSRRFYHEYQWNHLSSTKQSKFLDVNDYINKKIVKDNILTIMEHNSLYSSHSNSYVMTRSFDINSSWYHGEWRNSYIVIGGRPDDYIEEYEDFYSRQKYQYYNCRRVRPNCRSAPYYSPNRYAVITKF